MKDTLAANRVGERHGSRRAAHTTGSTGVSPRHYAKAVLLTGMVVWAFLVGQGNASFSSGEQNAANHFTAGYWVPRHLRTVGATGCGATSDAVVVTAPVAAGSTLVVRFAMRDSTNSSVNATDSKGNAYQLDAAASANKHDYAIFSAAVTNPLAPGDSITVDHHRSAKATFMQVDAFAGIAMTSRVLATNVSTGTGTSASVAAPLPAGSALTVAGIGVQETPTLAPPSGWTILDNHPTVCNRVLTTLGGYRITSAAGAATFTTSWSTGESYAGVIVVYKGA